MTFNIIKYKYIPYSISAVLFTVSVGLLVAFGLKPGIDFTGGSLIQVQFTEERPTVSQVQESLSTIPDLGGVQVQSTDNNAYIIKLKFISEDEHQEILRQLQTSFKTETNDIIEDRVDTIGPAISSHLRSRAFTAAIAVIFAIVAYVAYAFRKVSGSVASWKYGVTAIIALLHDVIITMGVFAVLGTVLGVEVDIPFVVAILTIMGYSVNDTIVVFDRIRESQISSRNKKFDEVVNEGVKSTLSRSVNTSLTTLLVLFALFFFGGESIHYFSLALIIGIALGTYSSIFLASPIIYEWYRMKHKKNA
jgi:preprotein translocase subunit SecF